MGNCKSSEAVVQVARYGNMETTSGEMQIPVAYAFADIGALADLISNTSGGLDEVIRRIHETETEKLRGPQPASKDTIENLPQLQANQTKTLSCSGHFCCAVCLQESEEDVTVKQLPCGHCFHVECVDEWLKRRCTCPTCRAKVA